MKVLVAATQQANDTAVQQERTSRRVAYAAIAISVLGILVGAGVSIAIAILKT